MQSPSIAGIILAAGKGTRMKSELPKGLHRICGIPMVEHVARAMKAAGVARPVIVIGHGGELIQEALGDGYDYAWQREQLGTGHAALMAKDFFADHAGPVIVAAGDTPLLQPEVFTDLCRAHVDAGAIMTLSTSIQDDPRGYGRIVRDDAGRPVRIVEQKDATEEERAIHEVNVALYCFDCPTLYRILPTLTNENAQGEYYLTDMVEAVQKEGGVLAAKIFDDPDVTVGVNDRWQLALADKEMGRRILKRHAVNGVTLMDIDSISIDVDVIIGSDTVIEPATILAGKTSIGDGCRIGPYTKIQDTHVGARTTILASYVTSADVGNDVWVGPFAHLRPKAHIADHAKVGNYVEIKNASVQQGAKVNHLSYIGDATVGEEANIGAGTITCNYDGFQKHRTVIGEQAFVGSHSTLVAPVTIGARAIVAAGSVVTHDVPDDAAAFGRARQETKEGWAARWRKMKKASREK
jgi:bifunctional UDP-N-acetylglucosamine pyrophosphorylase/glucosamine-1-phosphate N-acetyltransferase